MKFRFGSWCVKYKKLTQGHVDLLRTENCDLLALQQVSDSFHRDLCNANLFDWAISSLTLRPAGPDEGQERRRGCSVFGRKPFQDPCQPRLPKPELLGVHFPERTLVAHTMTGPTHLAVCSFDIPHGADYKEMKQETMKTVAVWLAAQRDSLVVGIDAKAPMVDHPDPQKVEWWPHDEPLLLGPSPLHRLRDAYRVYLEGQPALFDEIRTERPSGPLAISYLREREEPRRYDFIFVSRNICVREVYYRLEPTLCERALVVSRLELLPTPT